MLLCLVELNGECETSLCVLSSLCVLFPDDATNLGHSKRSLIYEWHSVHYLWHGSTIIEFVNLA